MADTKMTVGGLEVDGFDEAGIPSVAKFSTGTATYQTPILDEITHASVTIDYIHHETHEGSHYSYINAQDLTNAQTVSFVVSTPDTDKFAHFGFTLSAEAEFDLQMFEGASPGTIGTIVSAPAKINNNRNSAGTATTLIYHTPTLGEGSKGTLIARWHGGAGKTVGGVAGTDSEIVLKRNTKYWFDVKNETTSNNFFSWVVGWYEHTNRSA